jgi:formylglycine-generating enzyme required for sulfatase activity
VYLDAFWIDQTEVTIGMFEDFIGATGHITDAERYGQAPILVFSEDTWLGTTGANWRHPRGPSSSIEGISDHPVMQISWNDAQAYCNWVGRRLPTEAEWERAARGEKRYRFPWGDGRAAGNLVNFADARLQVSWASTDVRDGHTYTAAVGSFPDGASPCNVLDMAGNVWEWVADWYGSDYYLSSPAENPLGPTEGLFRVLRGGSWANNPKYLRVAERQTGLPDGTSDSIGFRCAMDASQ